MYHAPARWWLLRNGTSPDAVDDLVQSFLLDLWSKERLKNFERRHTKFRSFIIECLKNFRFSDWRKRNAKKRPPATGQTPLEECEPVWNAEVESGLDQQFAVTVHFRSLAKVQELYARRQKVDRFEALRPLILGDSEGRSYETIAQQLGISSGAVKKAVFDLRDAYFEAFRAEIAEITATESLEEEMRYLVGLLATVDPELLRTPLATPGRPKGELPAS